MTKTPTIIYTLTDEAPALATRSLLPIIRAFTKSSGITFDLQAAAADRSLVATRFSATAANAETHDGENPGVPVGEPRHHIACSLYVVVDGEVRFQREHFNSTDGVFEVDVPLREGDRYLTVIVADGDGYYDYDWAVLGDPVIELSPAAFAGE